MRMRVHGERNRRGVHKQRIKCGVVKSEKIGEKETKSMGHIR
jgi:hypothetical protein